jgi:phosphatidylglycerophosphate synthase
MGRYRARDLARIPSLLSLTRLPLAALFPFVVDMPAVAIGVLFAAGASDVLDGWWARRFNQATPTGAVVDAVTDKLFVASVLATLVTIGRLPLVAIALLGTREIGEAPLVVWFLASHEMRRVRAEQPIANLAGKLATAMQFATVIGAILRWSRVDVLLGATAGAGALAAILYWVREITRRRDAQRRLDQRNVVEHGR